MKKAISILLAVATMAFATSAMAATDGDVGTTANRKGTTAFVSNASLVSSMPCFRVGDTVTFDVSNLTSGKELTVITYKSGGSLSDSTVQYINQYTTTTSQTISYTVRDIDAGIYVLSINENGNKLSDFYYKIGTPTVELITASPAISNTSAYVMEAYDGKWSIGFVGKVKVDTGAINIHEIAPNAGFKITANGVSKQVGFGMNTAGIADNSSVSLEGQDLEITGGYSVLYGLTMYDVPEAQKNAVTAEVKLDANIVE